MISKRRPAISSTRSRTAATFFRPTIATLGRFASSPRTWAPPQALAAIATASTTARVRPVLVSQASRMAPWYLTAPPGWNAACRATPGGAVLAFRPDARAAQGAPGRVRQGRARHLSGAVRDLDGRLRD